MDIRQAIEQARKMADDDPPSSAYILRDFPEVKAAGLLDLAWALVKDETSTHKNDVIFFIEHLEKYLATRTTSTTAKHTDEAAAENPKKEPSRE